MNESPLLTYKPQDHLLEGARIRLVSFSNFSHFEFVFELPFLDMYMIGFCYGMGLDEKLIPSEG